MSSVKCIVCSAEVGASCDEHCSNCGAFYPKGCPEPECNGDFMVRVGNARFAGCSEHNIYHYIGSVVFTPNELPAHEGWELSASALRDKTPFSSDDSAILARALEYCRNADWPTELAV